jgi:hypothetical protein
MWMKVEREREEKSKTVSEGLCGPRSLRVFSLFSVSYKCIYTHTHSLSPISCSGVSRWVT